MQEIDLPSTKGAIASNLILKLYGSSNLAGLLRSSMLRMFTWMVVSLLGLCAIDHAHNGLQGLYQLMYEFLKGMSLP